MTIPARRRAPRAVDVSTPAPAFTQPMPPEDTTPVAAPAAPEPAPSTPPSPNGALGYIHTKRTTYGVGEEQIEEVRVPVFHATPAKVRVGGSVTQNLGDYNSARVEVSIEMPCLPEQSEVERVYASVSTLVDTMLRRELALATGQPAPTNH